MQDVSIIVPIYNVEKYLNRCIESLLNQTLENIQIILVNDGSTDNSGKIAKEYAKKNPDKIIYLEKENGGLSDARNYGIPYATGKYIAFLDSDDYIEKNAYKEMYNKACEDNYDYVECNFIWEYPNKKKIDKILNYNNKKEMLTNVRVVAWNKLIKREIVEKNKLEFPKGLRYEDVEFTYKLIPYLNTMAYIDKEFVHYIQRNNSIANVQNEKTAEIFKIIDNVIQYYKENNLFEEYKEELEYAFTRILLCSSLKRITKVENKEKRKELEKENWIYLTERFPAWKENKYLKETNSVKNMYMKTVNRLTYPIYVRVLRIL